MVTGLIVLGCILALDDLTIIGGATFENGVVEAMSIEEATVTVENVHIEHPVNINQVDVDVQYITVPSVFSLLLFPHSIQLNSINLFKISKVSKNNGFRSFQMSLNLHQLR